MEDSEGDEVFVLPNFSAWFLQDTFRDIALPPILMDMGDSDSDDLPTLQGEVLPP